MMLSEEIMKTCLKIKRLSGYIFGYIHYVNEKDSMKNPDKIYYVIKCEALYFCMIITNTSQMVSFIVVNSR